MPPPFHELLDSIAERSAVLRSVVAAAADLDARVPGCPDWTLRDLVEHVGVVQRSWAARVAAGDVEVSPDVDEPSGDLLVWSEESTQVLIDALRDVGPDAPCWTWWAESDAPSTAGAVARHQVQEAALHAYDAQRTIGQPADLPPDIAIDCVDEFLVVSLGAMGTWPHPPARVDVVATEGSRWAVTLTTVAKVGDATEGIATATITGSAADVILAFYSRIPLAQIHVNGDRTIAERLVEWAALST